MLADFIALSVDFGLRSEELLGLSWRDVHLDQEVYVQPSRAKSRVGRRVPILPRSLNLLQSIRRHPESLYVLWGEHGRRFKELWHAFQDAASHDGARWRASFMIARARASRVCLCNDWSAGLGRDLLAAVEKHGLEGIVSKRIDAPYLSGSRSGWIKVKTAAWRRELGPLGLGFRSKHFPEVFP